MYSGNLYSKSIILLGLWLILASNLFSSIFIGGLKVNYLVKLLNIFWIFLVVMYVWLNVKALRIAYTFHTRICDLIKNYVYHGKNQPYQEIGDGYIFVNIFVKEQSDYLTNNSYDTLLLSLTVMVELTSKPEFSFKVCNTACILPSFGERFIFIIFTCWFYGKLSR